MPTRRPAVAGQFYPAEPKKLRTMVERFVDDSSVQPDPERVLAIIAPHAGYMYSGPTAGYAYARVRGKKPARVVVVGCFHRYPIETVSIYTEKPFGTPLGDFPIDKAFAGRLATELDAGPEEPHLLEHALEVQLPFIHVMIGEVPIVPVLFGGPAVSWHVEAGRKLAGILEPGDLVVTSTDFSHYLSEDRASKIDKRTLDTILAGQPAALVAGLSDGTCSMCGGAAVVATMSAASQVGATDWKLLHYRTSAPVSGDYDRVVGYAALSMEFPG